MAGTYRYDAASGTTLFSSGLLDNATATRIATQETQDRFRVEIPTRVGSGDDSRWGKSRRWLQPNDLSEPARVDRGPTEPTTPDLR